MKKSSDELQHPRRNLGQRFRAQSERFMKLASKDPEREIENLAWAEQNARQSILHDFTDYKNWLVLAKTKKLLGDAIGLRLVLEDLFTVLGRDPENLEQLVDLNYLELGEELLAATLIRDPLDPDLWWKGVSKKDTDVELELFKKRCKILDFRDHRANIVFGRRLERIIADGREELFIELVQYLLSHRPTNYELWGELGKLHEVRGETDDAWLCYDNVQQLNPNMQLRDNFLNRIKLKFDGKGEWNAPDKDTRIEFNKRMGALVEKLTPKSSEKEDAESKSDDSDINKEAIRLESMISMGEIQAAFFHSRSLLAQGEEWASQYLEITKGLLLEGENDDD